MPVHDVAMPSPLDPQKCGLPTRYFEEIQITQLNDAELALCLARQMCDCFQSATLHHTISLTPGMLTVEFDERTMTLLGESLGLEAVPQRWEPIINEKHFRLVMEKYQTQLPHCPPPAIELMTWRRTLLQDVVQKSVTAERGDGHTTVSIPRLRR